jgi:hypothetical protein
MGVHIKCETESRNVVCLKRFLTSWKNYRVTSQKDSGVVTDGYVVFWTSLAAVGGAVLASVVTATVTYFVTKRSIDVAKAEGAANRQHEIDKTWTDRVQTRKLDAYISVTRSVENWMRQIGFVIADASVKFVPPLQQPVFDKITYEQEALVSLVGSMHISEALVEFYKCVNAYLAKRGTAAQMDGMVSEYEPESKVVAASWHQEFTKSGQAVIEAGKTIIAQMRAELQADGTHESEVDTAIPTDF